MQTLARSSTAGTAYTAAQVTQQLASPAVEEQWVFDRLDTNKNLIGDLTAFVDQNSTPEINHDSTRAVRRTLKLRVSGAAALTPLHDLIRPHHQIRMPDGGWIDFVLGTFTVLPSNREIRPGASWVSIDGADVSQLLLDAGFAVSTGLTEGTNVLAGIQTLIGSYSGLTPLPIAIPDPGKMLPAAIGWDFGASPLGAVNDLLAALNFLSAAADEVGTIRSGPIPDWNLALPVLAFDTTQGPMSSGSATGILSVGGILLSSLNIQANFSAAFNLALVIIEDPRRVSLSVAVPNNRADSPISIPNWHVKTKVIRDSRVVDYATAQAVGLSAIQEAARIYAPLVVDSSPWPASQDQDVYRVVYSTPDEGVVAANYVETQWTHRCKPGAPTTHTFTRIVPAGPS